MKILKLKFRNINSLAGDFAIDFTQPEFSESGIFLITGKTGAGKSSILDAISLALYGKTPRVAKISDKSNDVMTRNTTDCYSEIVFEVGGKQWKSSWKQEKKANGDLLQVKRVIADENNRIVADKIKCIRKSGDERTVDDKIADIFGLTFEQFTKVILLAQGGFAAFLEANKNEKGELLEQITGTEIYGEISKNVFERNKIENQKLERIIIELNAIKILSDEEIQNLYVEISQLEKEKILIDKELQYIEHGKKWLKDLSDLQKHINDAKSKLPELANNEEKTKATLEKAEKEVAVIRQEQEKFAPVFLKVRELDTKIAEKNNALNLINESLKSIENEKNKLSNNLQQQKNDLQKISSDLNQREEQKAKNAIYESLVENYSAIENQNSQAQSRLNVWHGKQTDFEKAAKDLDNKIADCEKAINNFNVKHQSLADKMRELEDQKKNLAYLLDGKELPALQSQKDEIFIFGNTVKSLIDNLKNIIFNKNEIENCEKLISENSVKEKDLNTKTALHKKTFESIKNQIDLLRENISFAKTIQNLEEHRKNLEDGKECPLCGSLEHPFAMGNAPVAGEKEKQLNELQKQFEEMNKTMQTDEKTLTKAASDRENAEKNKKAAETNLSENREKNRSEINNYDINIQENKTCLDNLEEILIEKRKEWKQIDALVKNAVQIEVEIKTLRDQIIPKYQQEEEAAKNAKTESETAKKLAENAKTTSETLANQEKLQYEIENTAFLTKLAEYGVDNIEKLKKHRDSWIENKETILKLSRQKIELEGNIKAIESSDATNQKQLLGKNMEKEQAETVKNDLVAERKALFGDKKPEEEEIRLKKQISDAEIIKTIAEKAKNDANTELAKTAAIIQESENRLSEKLSEKNTEKTPEELQTEYDAKKQQSDESLQKIGAKKQELEANNENLANHLEKLTKKEAQQQISDRWKSLDALIGSADGKKYRNFAQALTFENLIVLTNRQLKKMSERYILKRADDGANPFELSVIDKFQNCDERTAQNLSGGEKFIVSLALALGLSNMASRNMKIDTMFIDEGFGTLDSDYLNVALSALSSLQSEGKLIGIISHLAELRERIATHIAVIPIGGGCSKLETVC